jgi:dolichol kinase
MNHIGRKLYHLLGGLGLLSLYYLLGRDLALLFYVVLFCLVLVLDIARLGIPVVNRFVYSHFASFIRKNEEHKLTGTAPYVLGIASTLYLFPTGIATAAICFLAFGDVAATSIGERFGRTKIGGKSLEGTIAFIAAAAAAGFLLPVVGVPVARAIVLAGAVVAAGVELLPLPVNDNLVIPLVSASVMTLLCRFASCA